jgi:hypothetical protein
MMPDTRGRHPMLIVADGAELPHGERVWGTGGWRQPEQREALDWLTLARVSGWGVTLTVRAESLAFEGGDRWVVIACDPDTISEEEASHLARRLQSEPIVVIARAASAGTPMARLSGVTRDAERVAGPQLLWTGPGAVREWHCRSALSSHVLTATSPSNEWLTLDRRPVAIARSIGRGLMVTLGFHPSEWRDQDGSATGVLVHLLIWGALAPVAWFDWKGTLVLRMDDPGGAQNVFSRTWRYPKLSSAAWTAIAADLGARQARLSVGYVAGWVDDGDAARGELSVGQRQVARVAGAVYPSPEVRYRDLAGHAPGTMYDYESEFCGIQALRASGMGEPELHGYTHMHPDGAAWAGAPDRYEEVSWYRELGGRMAKPAAEARHPLALGIEAFNRYFGVRPTTLICPGDQWTNEALEHALDLGLAMVASYYLAIRHDRRFCWTTHICAPYLDEPHARWFDAGLPVIAYFHDREPALEGVEWIRKWLDAWEAAGAERMIDFRELSSVIGRRVTLNRDRVLTLCADEGTTPDLVRSLRLAIRVPDGPLPPTVTTTRNGEPLVLHVERNGSECGRVTLPVGSQIATLMGEGSR